MADTNTAIAEKPPDAPPKEKGRVDAELERYRTLMTPPSTFEDGFSWTSLAGAGFVALLMVPGAMYMSLLAGSGIGPAAQWVTVILFIEIAKRAHKSLSRAEIFVFFYIAGGMLATPFGGLLWNQFFVQSESVANAGIADFIPSWVAPRDPEVLRHRSFFQWAWLPVIGMIIFQNVIGRLNSTVLCYGLFRVSSDIEKLPFPMAPIGAQGILALAEDADEHKDESTRWRWRCFSIGGAIGMAFALVYIGLPSLSDAYLKERLEIFPIPFVDWTGKTQEFIPAVATGLSFDLGNLIVGMVMPFFAVIGSVFGMILTFVMNPILQQQDMLPSWQSGDNTIITSFKNTVDFYFSFGIGTALGLALIGFYAIYKSFKKARENAQATAAERADEAAFLKARGHIPFPIVLAVYVLTTLAYILLSGYLIDWHKGVMIVLLFYGFLYTPIISYVTARLEGMVGQAVELPLVREAGFILSGYKGGVAVWFIPLPLHNFGLGTVFYRQSELIGSRFWAIWKCDMLLFPIVMVSSILFANLIWSLAPLPSAAYPFASTMWELQAKNQCLVYTATLDDFSQFDQTFKPGLIAAGTVASVGLYGILSALGAPIFLMYGAVQSLNQALPHSIIPQFIGALLGRYYFEKKFGAKWFQYAPVLSAGYFCGVGLVSIFCIGMVFLSKAVLQTPF
ncbi:MAG TPA: peptide transporter [Planctomycetota bacterium]|nr:peptide transporter [Planctomycetota bacterium]